MSRTLPSVVDGDALTPPWWLLTLDPFFFSDEESDALRGDISCLRSHGHQEDHLSHVPMVPIFQERKMNVGRRCARRHS
jgi:hypothetical protein